MVTANELLKSLTNSDAEGHIVIGIDRRIAVPTSLKRIAVQYDHNIETVTFDCPRYWDGLDMSRMAVYINYMRSDGYTDSYPVSTVTVDSTDSSIMHFDWTISRNVTEVAGAISFLVCIKNTDGEGNEVNHWNSELCQDLTVSPGMETEEQIMDLSSDLVTQLLLRMDSVEQINALKGSTDWITLVDLTLDKTSGDDESVGVQLNGARMDDLKKCKELICFIEFTPIYNYNSNTVRLQASMETDNGEMLLLYASNLQLTTNRKARALSQITVNDFCSVINNTPIMQDLIASASKNITAFSMYNLKDINVYEFATHIHFELLFSSSQKDTQSFGAGARFKLIGRAS